MINEEYRARAFKIEICRAIKQSVLCVCVSPSFCHHFSTKLENSTMLEKNSIISYFAWIRAKRVKVEKYNKCFLGEFEIKMHYILGT